MLTFKSARLSANVEVTAKRPNMVGLPIENFGAPARPVEIISVAISVLILLVAIAHYLKI